MNFFYGNQPGAPALSTLGTGDLVRALDAALVNGFTAQSVTGITRSGSTVTVNQTAHGYYKGQRSTIAGAVQTDYNGTWRIASIVDANNWTFDIGVLTPTTPATGTITAALTGLGWGIAFTATNQRSYRAASGLRHYFMANDNSNTNTCIVRAFVAMTAVTTGTGPFPTAAQSDTNLRWPRPDPTAYSSTSAPNDAWVVVGDDKRFFIGITLNSSGLRYWYGFGEFQSFKSADAYNTFIMGAANTDGTDVLNTGLPSPYGAFTAPNSQGTDAYYTTGLAFARAQNQTTASYIGGYFSGFVNNTQSFSVNAGSAVAGTSSPISGGIELSFMDVVEATAAGSNIYNRRGRLPIFCPWQYPDFPNNDGAVYTGLVNFPDILLVRGWAGDPNSGLIFPVGDWDTVLS